MCEKVKFLKIGPYDFVHASDINKFVWKNEITIDLENAGVDYVYRVKQNTYIGLQAKPKTYNGMTFQKRHNRSGNKLFKSLYKGSVLYFDGSLGRKQVIEILLPKIKQELQNIL
ncbi:MAG: hypothetical protein ACOC4J_05230 [Bacteroidota bacterium]